MQEQEFNINFKLHYPYSDQFEFKTFIERIDLDKERENDIKSGRGFFIKAPKGIKNDIKLQDGIFSIQFGSGLQDADSFQDRYRCKCGATKGSINHGMICPACEEMVKYVDDDMSKFGWIVVKEPFTIIHPNLYMALQAFIGEARLDKIICPKVDINEDGKIIKHRKQKKKKRGDGSGPFEGIGIMEFRDRFDEIMDFYLKKFPQKKDYYDDIMKDRDIVFARSIPVFTTFLRPAKLDNNSLKYETTNEDYQMISALQYRLNDTRLGIFNKKKQKLNLLYDIQVCINNIYMELKEILSKKKGDIRSSIGGRYAFSSRSVITQSTDLKPDQVRLPYHGLCELLQQVIINILYKPINILGL